MNDEAKAVRSETRHSRPLPSHHPLFHHPSYGEAGPQGVYDGRRAEAYGSLRSLSLRHLTYETERDMNRMPRALPFTTGPSRYALRLRV